MYRLKGAKFVLTLAPVDNGSKASLLFSHTKCEGDGVVRGDDLAKADEDFYFSCKRTLS